MLLGALGGRLARALWTRPGVVGKARYQPGADD
jgi:hypothetical protein